MTKAKGRQRAKARAQEKAKKRASSSEHTDQRIKPAKFDQGTLSMKGRSMNANVNNFSPAKRGSARSK